MARPRKNEETASPWVVRDVPEETRRKVRVYAAEHDLTMAQAIEALVNLALARDERPDRSRDFREEPPIPIPFPDALHAPPQPVSPFFSFAPPWTDQTGAQLSVSPDSPSSMRDQTGTIYVEREAQDQKQVFELDMASVLRYANEHHMTAHEAVSDLISHSIRTR